MWRGGILRACPCALTGEADVLVCALLQAVRGLDVLGCDGARFGCDARGAQAASEEGLAAGCGFCACGGSGGTGGVWLAAGEAEHRLIANAHMSPSSDLLHAYCIPRRARDVSTTFEEVLSGQRFA